MNPSISYGSIFCLKIKDIKRSYEDVTISISNLLLKSLGGDYDGDTLNIIPLMDNSFKETFDVFDPSRMIINNDDLKFNSSLGLDKDQILGLYSFLR
jgi:hypothetical protein